jgi:hypothetical protein
MAESHVVSGLAAKRSELTGLIAHHQAAAKRLAEDVAHIDATIKILAPDFDLRTVRAKEYRVRSSVFNHGEALVQVLDVMREADAPITSTQIAKTLLDKRGGMDEADYNCAAKHINNALQRLKRKGMAEICGNIPGKGHGTHIWKLV